MRRRRPLSLMLALVMLISPLTSVFADVSGDPMVYPDVPSGVYEGPWLQVRLTSDQPGSIYYTLDGSDPIESSSAQGGDADGTFVLLPTGIHTLSYRAENEDGDWSDLYVDYYKVTGIAETPATASQFSGENVKYAELVQADGENIVYARNLYVGDIDDWENREVYLNEVKIAETDFHITFTGISGDDIIFGNDQNIYHYSISAGDEPELLYTSPGSLALVKIWNGTIVMMESESRFAISYDLKTFDVAEGPSGVETINHEDVFSFNPVDIGSNLIVWYEFGDLLAYSLSGVRYTFTLHENIGFVEDMAISGQYVFFRTGDTLFSYDLASTNIREVVSLPGLSEIEADPLDSRFVVAYLGEPIPALVVIHTQTAGFKYLDFDGDYANLSDFSIADGVAYWTKEIKVYEEADSTIYIDQAPVYALDLDGLTDDQTPPNVTLSPDGGSFIQPVRVSIEADEEAVIFYTYDDLPGIEETTFMTLSAGSIPVFLDGAISWYAVDFFGNQTPLMTTTPFVFNSMLVPIQIHDTAGWFDVSDNRILYLANGELKLYDLRTGAARVLLEPGATDMLLWASIDGSDVVYQLGYEIIHYDVTSGTESVVGNGMYPYVHDGKIVYTLISDANLYIYDLQEQNTNTIPAAAPDHEIVMPQIHDTHLIYYENELEDVFVYDLEGNDEWISVLDRIAEPGSTVYDAVLTPQDVFLIINDSNGDDRLYRYSLQDGSATAITDVDEAANLVSLSYDPVSHTVSVVDYEYEFTLLYDIDKEQENVLKGIIPDLARLHGEALIFHTSIDQYLPGYAILTFLYLGEDQTAPEVSISPKGDLYGDSVTVTIHADDNRPTGIAIYYTTDGTEPTTASTRYTGPFTLTKDAEVRAFAVDGAGNVSNIASVSYEIDSEPPKVNAAPSGGIYREPQHIWISANEPATIYFSIDGSEPTVLWDVYYESNGLSIVENTILKFKGIDQFDHESQVFTETYVIDAEAPQVSVSPAGGVYEDDVTVTFSVYGDEPDVTIYYTLDGTEPDEQSAVYSEAIVITASAVLKFFAEDAAGNRSETITVEYVIERPPADEGGGDDGGGHDGGGDSSGDHNAGTNPDNGQAESAIEFATDEQGNIIVPVQALTVEQTIDANGRTSLTAALDADILQQSIGQLLEGDTSAHTIIFSFSEPADRLTVTLPAASLAAHAEDVEDLTLSVRTADASYDLPASLIGLDELASSLGADAEEITISLTIEKVKESLASQIEIDASRVGVRVVGEPIEFHLTASANGNSVEISSFGSMYVVRTITIHEDAGDEEWSAVLYDPITGTFTFVPSVVERVHGQTYVHIMRNGNSIYAVISGKITFADIAGHWAQADIESLASRLLLQGQGPDRFAPDAVITRAEVAAMLVRALGLTDGPANGAAAYTDVSPDAWYAPYIQLASAAGLISGYLDGSFRPDQAVSRVELAAMTARALGYAGADLSADASVLNAFADHEKIAGWARPSVATVAEAGIIHGKPDGRFAPEESATRAEAAVILKRALLELNFIN